MMSVYYDQTLYLLGDNLDEPLANLIADDWQLIRRDTIGSLLSAGGRESRGLPHFRDRPDLFIVLNEFNDSSQMAQQLTLGVHECMVGSYVDERDYMEAGKPVTDRPSYYLSVNDEMEYMPSTCPHYTLYILGDSIDGPLNSLTADGWSLVKRDSVGALLRAGDYRHDRVLPFFGDRPDLFVVMREADDSCPGRQYIAFGCHEIMTDGYFEGEDDDEVEMSAAEDASVTPISDGD